MSDRLREALATWEAWQRQDIALNAMQAADLIQRLEPAARRFLALTETGPDYEAAIKAFHRGAPPPYGFPDDVRNAVDAALADYLTEDT